MTAIQLHADWDGPGESGQPTLVLLHGFSTNLTSWEPVRDGLRRIGPTLAVDLIGHGQSPAPEELTPYRMEACLDQLEGVLAEYEIPRAWWVGYSMGGRVAMRAVLGRPVGLLVLVSVSAGIRSEALRAERVAADAALADRIEDEGMSVFLDEWDRLPMFAGLAGRSDAWKEEERRLRLENDPKGVAAALRGMGQGVTVPLSDEVLSGVTSPTVLLAGSEDGAYAREAVRLAGVFPAGKCVVHPTGGHSLVSEDPGWVAIHVRRGL